MSASQDILLYWPTAVAEIQGRYITASTCTYVLFIALIVISEVLTSVLQLQLLSRLYLPASLPDMFYGVPCCCRDPEPSIKVMLAPIFGASHVCVPSGPPGELWALGITKQMQERVSCQQGSRDVARKSHMTP